MKYFLSVLALLLIIFTGFVIYDMKVNESYNKIVVEDDCVIVDKYYIYGVHLNIEGKFNMENDTMELVLYNGKTFLKTSYIYNDGVIKFSDNVNDGFYLDSLGIGKYYLFLRSSYTDEDGVVSYKYYSVKNNTSYDNAVYYTMSDINNKIDINFDNKYGTMTFIVKKNRDKDIYDVVVDAGHGGADEGAYGNGYDEIDFTVEYAKLLLDKLNSLGYKARLTWDGSKVSSDKKINEYGPEGRAVIPNEVKAKYLISIHINSGAKSVSGIEVYTASGINYDFARDIADNMVNYTGIGVSRSRLNKFYDGVYTRNFTDEDVKHSLEEYAEKGINAYDVSTKSSYYYMIRETGGIITGAYVDDRNDKTNYNLYYNSNVACESYLLELGYITNANDVDILVNKKNEYINAIADAFVKNMERNKQEESEIVEITS